MCRNQELKVTLFFLCTCVGVAVNKDKMGKRHTEEKGCSCQFFFLLLIGAKDLHRPLYRPPRRTVHIYALAHYVLVTKLK